MASKEFLSPKEDRTSPYLKYPGKPIIMGRPRNIVEGDRFINGQIKLQIPSGEEIIMPENHRFNRAEQTLQELTGSIHPDSPLYEEFRKATVQSASSVAVYYPQNQHLVLYASPEWHKTALLLRNSFLIRDPNQEITWGRQRKIFDALVIGVAGASVGKNVLMRIVEAMRPNWVKIADPKTYKDTNSNRTELAYWDIGVNKAVVAAQQVHRNDPFTNISVYEDGLTDGNMKDFVGGDESKNEPPLDYLVEETDDPNRKVESLKFARKYNIPLLMVTDIGSAYQIDVRDFKKNPDSPLVYGVADDEIFMVQRQWQADRKNISLLLIFAMTLVGNRWRDVPEFSDFVSGSSKGISREIPQLGIAANAGASHLALTLAKHALGADIPERFFVNLASRRIVEEGSIL